MIGRRCFCHFRVGIPDSDSDGKSCLGGYRIFCDSLWREGVSGDFAFEVKIAHAVVYLQTCVAGHIVEQGVLKCLLQWGYTNAARIGNCPICMVLYTL